MKYKAQAMLEKFGWKSGMGLGKNMDGITTYIAVQKKKDNAGIGSNDQTEDMWWDNAFNRAAANIQPGAGNANLPEPTPMNDIFIKSGQLNQQQEGLALAEDDKGLFDACENRLLRKYAPEGKLKRLAKQDAAFASKTKNGDSASTLQVDIDKAKEKQDKKDRKERKKDKKDKKEKKEKKGKEDAEEEDDKKDKKDKKEKKNKKETTEEECGKKDKKEKKNKKETTEEECGKKEKKDKKDRKEKKDKSKRKDKVNDKKEKKLENGGDVKESKKRKQTPSDDDEHKKVKISKNK